ncbi:MAG: XdhC family aldehyde oxidoreductase maturation factor [Thermodesulfobacteriota bacterium]
MSPIFSAIEGELRKGRGLALATIISSRGSTPRGPGTRMMIRSDGSFIGTIGGGKIEAEVLAESSAIFKEKKNKIIAFQLKGEEAAQADLICGGELEIFLEYYPGKDEAILDFFSRMANLRNQDRPALFATLVEEGPSFGAEKRLFLFVSGEDQEREPPFWLNLQSPSLPEVLRKKTPVLWTGFVQDKEKRIFLEPLVSTPRLIIFGAGHVSAALCPLAKTIGFQVTVVDDRADFASPDRFPEADDLVVRPMEQTAGEFRFLPTDFVVIMTRGHLFDHQVLRRVLSRPLNYIGMIGSRKKMETIFKALREEKFPAELLNTVHSPIGLEIGAETPEEIAVSIAAELIQVRARNRGKRNNITTIRPSP